VAALAVPAAATAAGAGLTHSGHSGGLRLAAPGLAFRSTGAGQVVAVAQLCSVIPSGSSVVILDRTLAEQFTQVIRGMCGVPAAWMAGAPPGEVTRVLDGIARAGRRPILLGSGRGQLAGFGGTPARVVDLATTQDPDQLTSPPVSPVKIRFVIWMTEPQGRSVGT